MSWVILISFNMIDEVLSSTTKGDMVHYGMDNGQDAGVEDQPTNQLKEAT